MTKLFELIKKYESIGDFTHCVVSDKMLQGVEARLQIKIPLEYREFLKEFGHGGIGGIEIIGVGKNGIMLFEHKTLQYCTYGLLKELIVVENCDEWIYCINSRNGKVVMWDRNVMGYFDVYENFYSYLNDRVNDVLENI